MITFLDLKHSISDLDFIFVEMQIVALDWLMVFIGFFDDRLNRRNRSFSFTEVKAFNVQCGWYEINEEKGEYSSVDVNEDIDVKMKDSYNKGDSNDEDDIYDF